MSYSPVPYFVVMISAMPITSLVSIAIYVFRSLGLYSMAENTGISHPWMAWVPFVRQYLLGRLADRYAASQGQQTSYRIFMPAIQCGGVALVTMGAISWVVRIVLWPNSSLARDLLSFLGLVALWLVIMAASAVITVLGCYKVFLDYEPTSAVAYTVLAFFGLDWIPLFLCRNNVPTGIAGHCSPKQPRYQVGNRRM